MNLFLVGVYLFSVPAMGAERSVSTDADNYIAVGYSENADSLLAKQDSCNSARKELISYIFGASYQINQSVVKSAGILDYSQNIETNSTEVTIRGAVIDTDLSHGIAKCTITYPVSEAKIEIERLKSAKSFSPEHVTEVGDPSNLRGGVLQIMTVPEDADVFIDNVRWGVTPLKLYGKLGIGEHLLRLEHDSYEGYEAKILIGQSNSVHVEKVLKRAMGVLNIETVPSGAVLFIDGQRLGESPKNGVAVLAGRKVKIHIEHPQADPVTITVSVRTNETRNLQIPLQLKPGLFSIHVEPSDSLVKLDDGQKIEVDAWASASAGTHILRIHHDGYDEKEISFQLDGNEKKALPTVNLDSVAPEVERYRHDGPRWSSGLFIGSTECPVSGVQAQISQVGMNLRYQWTHLLSIEATAVLDYSATAYSDATLNVSGNEFLLGAPLTLLQFERSEKWIGRFSISPEVVTSSHTFKADYNSSSNTNSFSVSQNGAGGALIYSAYQKAKYDEKTIFVDFRAQGIQYRNSNQFQGALVPSFAVVLGVAW